MNEEQMEELRRWAISICSNERPELRAAGKAILLLLDDLALARRQALEEHLMTIAERIGSSRKT